MDIIKTLINKVLAVIPVDQKILGYILIGVGILILLLVIVTLVAKLFKKSPTANYQSKFQGARLTGSFNNLAQNPLTQNPNPSFNPATSPIRGNFPPKQNLGGEQGPGEFGLSKLKSQVEIESQPQALNIPSQRQAIPNINQPIGFQGGQSTSRVNPNLPSGGFVNIPARVAPKEDTSNKPPQMFSQSNPPAGFSMPVRTAETPQIKPKTIDPNLVDYIKKTKSLGYPNSAIRSELIKVGWNPIDVDQALSTSV